MLGYSTGTFDMIHENHIRLLRTMKYYCNVLIIGLTSDRLAAVQKRPVWMPFEQRRAILMAMPWVDSVVEHDGDGKDTALNKLHFDVLLIGEDYHLSEEYSRFGRAHPEVKVVYLPRHAHVNTSDRVRAIEERVLRGIRVCASGTGGPIMRHKNTIIKAIHVGLSEINTTANVYKFSFPPPRNWKRVGATEEHPNYNGINSMREVLIQQFIQGKPWNPVTEATRVFESNYQADQREDEPCPITERSRPHHIYWLHQWYAGKTLLEWHAAHGDDSARVDHVCRQIDVVFGDLQSLGIVHGDVHGTNLLVDENDKVSLIDFGWCYHPSFALDEEERRFLEDSGEWDRMHFQEAMAAAGVVMG